MKLVSSLPTVKGKLALSLVIVLCSLVFLSGLIVAFLGQMGTELKSSKLYAEGNSARILAQSANNIVMAEIKEATRGVDETGGDLAWASQPGMIRTYNTNGEAAGYFKLYSDSDMVGRGRFDPAIARAQLSNWETKRALYTDLNQPAFVTEVTSTGPTQAPTYPIFDPGAEGIVEGFKLEAPPIGTNPNPAPMPAKWLYVLANGEIIAPDSSSATKATFSDTVIKPTTANPIIGRVAFWTDDESAKINLNTASDGFGTTSPATPAGGDPGTYWDTPKFSNRQDFNYANYQPAQNEFQRYAGHPAMVALSSVFPKPAGFTDALWAEEIYNIVPRIKGGAGSSRGGTSANSGAAVVSPDGDRLYASVEELAFKPSVSGGKRDSNDPTATHTVLNRNSLKHAQFFLTAHSRSSDLNLFNKPRVGIWPISSTSTNRSPYDQLIAFCSSVAGYPFYFQRSNALSATEDLPDNETTGLVRNREVLEYLRSLTSRSIPGFGGTFAAKYSASNGSNGTDRDQILTEIFDYIRSTNIADKTVTKPFHVPSGTYSAGAGEVVPIEDRRTHTRGFGRFPTVQGAFILFAGIGDNSTSSTIPAGQTRVQALFFVNLNLPSAGYSPSYNPNLKLRIDGLQNFQWQTADATGKLTMTSMGFPAAPAKTPTSPGTNVSPTTWSVWGTQTFGGTLDWRKFLAGQVDWFSPPNHGYKLRSAGANMPSQTSSSTPATFFEFKGGPVTIEIVGPDAEVCQTVILDFPDGKINSSGTDQRFPVPMLASGSLGGFNFRNLTSPYGSKPRADAANSQVSLITPADVVRSVVPTTGDLRLVLPRGGKYSPNTQINALLPTYPNQPGYPDFFTTHRNYTTRTAMLAHNMRNGDNQPYYGATAGRLLDLDYQGSARTKTVYTANNPNFTNEAARDSALVPNVGTNILGDWDNSVAGLPDGPFINRADEGIVAGTDGYTPYYGYTANSIPPTLFSPNRMMPSAGMFGSLPTGVWSNKPWQTLLFCPNPLQGSTHPGFGVPAAGPPYTLPPDYLLLDLFHMPVVEPYAISEPLSTAGRINMNFQIVPYTYVKRNTGIRALLKSEKLIAVPDSKSTSYKTLYTNTTSATSTPFRLNISADQTITRLESRFTAGDIYRSPAEICSIHLVPEGYTGDITTYWNDKRLTGDNSRERPYTTLYPRLTTKSNTYTIHVRAQSLRKSRRTDVAQWSEGIDQVTGEYRGSQTIERYVDPNDRTITVDFANPSVTTPLADYYKLRVINTKQFAP